MRTPLPRTCWCNPENVWNALVGQMQLEPGGMQDIEDFWDFCHGQLCLIAEHHRRQADPREGIPPGYAKRMRHLSVIDACDEWAGPSKATLESLLHGAREALVLARRSATQPETRAFALAEMKLCLLFADARIADLGLEDGELRALEESCNAPAPAREAAVA